VHTQTVFNFRPTSAAAPRTSREVSAGTSNVISICESPAFIHVAENETPESKRDALGCARGIRAAFVLEGGLGLAIYALWHFRHVLTAIHLAH
jgi:hypothetical protein